MKREELEIYWGSAECVPDRVYEKEEADSVMDAMERRIARLAALVEGFKKNSLILGEMYHKRLAQEQARIKELEEKLEMKLDPALYPNCNDCDKCSVVISKMERTAKENK